MDEKDKAMYLMGLVPNKSDEVFDLTEHFNKVKNSDPYYKDYEIQEIDLDKLAKDNGLMDNSDLESYHEEEWGEDANKYRIDNDKMNKWGSYIPRATLTNTGRIKISDGRHRIRALINQGYKKIKLPIIKQ